ncbi:hypothetical protein MIND_00782000 [Mycena indigotica]|uniref:Uncharacterized protein n=1 Tax=Mycena indigotica TaxID=2126181 RepID=A0A8H6SMK4_9AGAR|nr:uncharacterized protein MIND_00782000 [Mycena indigotica]KAF7302151.1 hypothetical protein MIND_00782000 [Mycena indigotica]
MDSTSNTQGKRKDISSIPLQVPTAAPFGFGHSGSDADPNEVVNSPPYKRQKLDQEPAYEAPAVTEHVSPSVSLQAGDSVSQFAEPDLTAADEVASRLKMPPETASGSVNPVKAVSTMATLCSFPQSPFFSPCTMLYLLESIRRKVSDSTEFGEAQVYFKYMHANRPTVDYLDVVDQVAVADIDDDLHGSTLQQRIEQWRSKLISC